GGAGPAAPEDNGTSSFGGSAAASNHGGSGSAGGGGGGTGSSNVSLTGDYMLELKDLQHKIMTLQDNTELQRVVEMIAATGCYEITSATFDFDLCALDVMTVRRLQDFFATS
uniref:AF-9 ANC1 homology domain-containing protein n=1 Tax=Anopheles melas TaxID=34690 RepID=A0A182UIB0_9DIPT